MDILHISLANLRRKPSRTAAIFLGICALTAMLVALSLVHLSVNNSIEAGRSRLGADAMVVPSGWEDKTMGVLLSGGPTEFYMKSSIEDMVREVPGVADTATQLFVVSAPFSCCSVSETMLVGIDPERDFTISPWLRESLHQKLQPKEIIVGSNILAEPKGHMKFYGTEFLIAGKLEPTGMKYIDSSIFIPIQGVRDMIAVSKEKAVKPLTIGNDEISDVMVKLKDGANPGETALRIENAIPGVKVILSSRVLSAARKNLSVPLKVMALTVVVQWLVSLFMIGVLFAMSISEREKEVGIIRATGARPSHVFKLFIYEMLIIAGAGGLVGVIIGLAVVMGFHDLVEAALKVPFLLPGTGTIAAVAALALLLALTTSVLATIRPIIKISRKSPFSAMQAGI